MTAAFPRQRAARASATLGGALLLGCVTAPVQGDRVEVTTIYIPKVAPTQAAQGGEPLPASSPVVRYDALEYYVGAWDGVASVATGSQRKTWETVLEVEPDGAFNVSLSPGQGEACALSGQLLVAPGALILEVVTNSCDSSEIGHMVRTVVERHRDEFVLRTPDGQSMYRYTRRRHAE